MSQPVTPPPQPSELAFRTLVRTYGLLHKKMGPYFVRFGISGAQWGVLRTLYRAELAGEAGLRLMDVGKRLLVKPPSVTGIVDRLERMGLVAREASAADLRAKHVRLTDEGRELLERALQHHPKQIHKLMGGLNATEQIELQGLLERLALHLESMGSRGAIDS